MKLQSPTRPTSRRADSPPPQVDVDELGSPQRAGPRSSRRSACAGDNAEVNVEVPGCTITLRSPRRVLALAAVLCMLLATAWLAEHIQGPDVTLLRSSLEYRVRHLVSQVPGSTVVARPPAGELANLIARPLMAGLAPAEHELVQHWVDTGSAKVQGVRVSEQHVDGLLAAGGAVPTDQERGRFYDRYHTANFNRSWIDEPHGATGSSWRSKAWMNLCQPYVRAVNHTEVVQKGKIQPLETQINPRKPIADQVADLVTAALFAMVVGRPFRASIGADSFSADYVKPSVYNWKLFEGHFDKTKGGFDHVYGKSIHDFLSQPDRDNPAKIALLDLDQSFQLETMMGLLTRKLTSKYGRPKDAGVVPVREAVLCAVHTLLKPSDEMLAQIDDRLESAADMEGVRLMLGVTNQFGANTPADVRATPAAAFGCIWETYRASVINAREAIVAAAAAAADPDKGTKMIGAMSTAWVVPSDSAGTVPNAAAATIAKPPMADLPVPTLLTLPPDGKLETAWLEFFLLSETHKCVTIGGDPLEAKAINIGCAASLRQFDILHRTNPERLADVGPGYCDPGDAPRSGQES